MMKTTTSTDREMRKRLDSNIQDLVDLDDINPFDAPDYLEREYGERELRKMERRIRGLRFGKSIRLFWEEVKKFLAR